MAANHRRERGAFISWVEHARATGLAEALEMPLYVPAKALLRAPWPLRYSVQALLSVWYLVRRRPNYVIFTNPPFVAGLVLLLAARRLRIPVWCDAHSGAFNDERWRRFAGANRFVLNRCSGIVIHNRGLADEARRDLRPRLVVVGSPPLRERPSAPPATPKIVATLGWAFDEPIAELLEAIRTVPEISVSLTGRHARLDGEAVPPNCTLTGWLRDDEYDELLSRATAVICLTDRENTMQTGAYEAIEHGTPLILSGTRTLRDYCDCGGVVFVDDHKPATLAQAMRVAVAEEHSYRRDARLARPLLVERSHRQRSELSDAIAATVRSRR
jgi:glycosyltransferase involved in cell wall biosynthesis